MLRRLALPPVLLAAALAAGCGSDTSTPAPKQTGVTDPAARFAVRVDVDLTRGRFAKAWQSLHPAQQRLLSPTALADCWSRSSFAEEERSLRFEAKDVSDEPVPVPGVAGEPRPSRAVRVKILHPGEARVLDTITQHVFRVGDGYRWIVSAAIMRDFRRGACGST